MLCLKPSVLGCFSLLPEDGGGAAGVAGQDDVVFVRLDVQFVVQFSEQMPPDACEGWRAL